jgi:RHS repeat-associated protein
MRKRLNYYSIFQRVASLLLAVLLIPIPSFAQSSSQSSSSVDQSTPGALATGTHPLGSYGGSSFDSVNLFNGNLSLSFPIAALSGRGGVGGGVVLSYNSKFWRVDSKSNSNPNGSNTYAVPTYDHYDKEKPVLAPGWDLHLGRMVGRQSSWSDVVNGTTNSYTLTTFTFSAPDGTEYNFRDDLTDGQPLAAANNNTPNQSRGKKFHSTDGTAATFISNNDIVDIPFALHQYKIYPDGVVVLRDGTRFILARGKVKEQHDRNGNIARYEYQGARLKTITDSIGRTITLDYIEEATQPDPTVLEIKVTIKGFAGADRVTSIKFGKLQHHLLPNLTNKTYSQLFPTLDVPSGGDTTLFDPIIVKEIDLPSTHQWKFFYNEYAEVTRVETPARGAVEYDMSVSSGAFAPQSQNHQEIFRRILERRIYPNASSTTVEGRTVYGDPSTDAAVQGVIQKVFNGDGRLLARTRHKFAISPLDGYGDTGVPPKTGYQRWMQGKEIETAELSLAGNDSSATVKRLTQHTWEQRAPISWISGSTKTFTEQPENDPRTKTETVTYPDSGQVFRTEYLYDDSNGFGGFNNVTTESIFDNNVLLRKEVRTYETDINYVQYQDSATDQNLVLRPHLRSLIKSKEVFHVDSSNNDVKESHIEYEYDNYANNPIQSLTFVAGDISHNLNYNTNFTRRGNLTGATSGIPGQVNSFSEQSTITTQYDIAGNVIKTVGPLPTQIATLEYDTNNFYFPLASHQVVPGVPQEFITRKTFDFSTGLTTSTAGINGEATSYFYNDPEFLDRITEIRRPSPFLGKTTYTYSPVGSYPSWIKIQTQQDNNPGNDLIAIGYFDGWLKPIKSERFDPDGSITSETAYDGLGRAFKVTNSHRAAPADTDGYTITEYEDLGRTSKVTSFDKNGSSTGSIISAYLGTTTTVTDQALKQRKNKIDALGRLISVFEPDTNNQLTLETQYKYDARSNLTEVDQGQQARTFVYDSQSRLRRSTTPEAGVTNYVYDETSNLRIRTDARGITTTYTYDALNRIKTKVYSDNTPPVSYFYDGIFSGLPAGVSLPQGYQPGTTLGRLVAVATPNTAANNVVPSLNATATFYSYDLVGRITNGYQLIDGQYFQTNTNYNLASAPTHFQYPSANVLDYTYNSTGQLDNENYNNNPIVSQIKYTANGAITQQQLGNGLYHNITYNSRFQPTTISLGSTASGENSYDKIRLDYDYGLYPIDTLSSATSPLPDNVQLDQTKNNGNIGRIRVTHGAFSTGGGGGGSNLANPGNGSKSNTVIKGGKPLYNLIYNPTMEQGFAYDELNRLVLAKEFTATGVNGPTCPQLNAGTLFVEPGTTSTVVLTGSDLNSVQQVNITPSTGLTASIIGVSADKLTLNIVTDASAGGMQYGLSVVGSCGEISASGISVSCYATNNLVTNMDVTGVDAVGGLSFELDNGPKDGVSTVNKQTVTGTGSIDIDLTPEHFDLSKLANPVLTIHYSANTQILPSTSVTATYQSFINGVAVEGHIPGTGTSVPASDVLGITVDASGNVTGNGVGPDKNSRFQDIEVPLTGAIGSKITFSYQATITTTSSNGVFPAVVTGINGSGGCIALTVAQPFVQVTEPSPLAQGASWYQAYTYDRYGNRTKVEGDNGQTLNVEPTNNRITDNGHTYDAAGNVKTDQQGNTYFYDAENRMIKAQSLNGSFHLFQYDGDGHRIKKKDLGQSGGRLYVHAGTEQLIAEYLTTTDGQAQLGATDKEYIYGASGLVATRTLSGAIEFITPDHLGSPRVFTDAGGNIISRHDYFPFGGEITGSFNGRNAMGGFGGDDKLAQKFTGYERDDETGLDFAQARYYNSAHGRYMSTDPIFITPDRFYDPQQFNLYPYTRNNPLRYIDPSGKILTGSGEIDKVKKHLREILGTDDADKRVTYDEKTNTITIDLSGIDLKANEGANLLNDLVVSKNTYEISEGATVMTDKGPISITYINVNLPTFGDQTKSGNPRTGVSDVVAFYFNNPKVTRASNTKLKVAPEFTLVFHELAEAYEKIDGGKGSYEAGHNAALERENKLREQRPYLKDYNTGAGGKANDPNPQGKIIVKK